LISVSPVQAVRNPAFFVLGTEIYDKFGQERLYGTIFYI